jgi:hypothetical protein
MLSVVFLYGRTGRLAALACGFRPGQYVVGMLLTFRALRFV